MYIITFPYRQGLDKIIERVQILLQYFNVLRILWEFISIVDRFIYLLDCIFVIIFPISLKCKIKCVNKCQIVRARLAAAYYQNSWTAWFFESYHIKNHDGIQEARKILQQPEQFRPDFEIYRQRLACIKMHCGKKGSDYCRQNDCRVESISE